MRWMAEASDTDLHHRCRADGELLVPAAAHDSSVWTSGDGRDMPDEPVHRANDVEGEHDDRE